MSTISIQLNIGGRTFSIQVERESEQVYRDAAKMINRKLQQYVSSFPDQPKEDYTSMVMLDIAVSLIRENNADDRLREMSRLIDKTISGKTDSGALK